MRAGLKLRSRRFVVLCVLGAAAAGLLWRALDLQLNHKEFLQTQGDARHLRVVRITATRGKILDRNGQPLAISTPVDSIWVNPRELAAERERWPVLIQRLGLDPDTLHRLIADRIDREFVYLRRHVEPRLAAEIASLHLAGVYRQREYRRYYPTGEVAAHVVGFTNVDDIGQEGLELAFDESLRGSDGSKRVVRDRFGQAVEDVEYIETPRDGSDLVLSIDRRIQYLAYRALKGAVKHNRARGGSIVLLDARTGEILAMANQPAYNPNNRAERAGDRYRNRAVTDVFEPGSTVKPFTVVSALESGRFQPTSPIDTAPGILKIGGHKVSDLRNFGRLDVSTVIKKSSNVGASKIALALPPKRLWQTLNAVGFGRPSGSIFPGESAGILTDYGQWSEFERATLSFGYGLSVTALQLAQAYGVIASGGLLYPVSFQKVERPQRPRRVLSARAALEVRTMLEGVTEEDGTGARARISGYRVAGKTGTIRKSTAGGYSLDRYVAVFAGMAPASAPRLVAVVTIDEPGGEEYYGGHVAAPVFAQVLEAALRLRGVAPDAPVVNSGVLVSVDGNHDLRRLAREVSALR